MTKNILYEGNTHCTEDVNERINCGGDAETAGPDDPSPRRRDIAEGSRVGVARDGPALGTRGGPVHGIVLKGLKDFVVETYDRETWTTLQNEAGLPGRMYVPVTEYPDEDVLALVETASELTEVPAPELLRSFGRFMVPKLVETYGVHVDADWTGLELVANVEAYIHIALRAKRVSTYTPPELESEWRGEDSVRVVYRSDRELCHLARGIFDGIGDYFDEPLAVEESTCMHDGDDRCVFVVRRAAGV